MATVRAAALPVWTRGVQKTLPAPTVARFAKLKLASEASAAKEVKSLHLKKDELPKALAGLYASSPAKARTFTKGVVANWKTPAQATEESRPVFGWALKAGKAQRRMLIHAMAKSHGIAVVDNVGELSRGEARTVMKEYFAEGGHIGDVLEWMRACGEYLRQQNAAGDSDTDLLGLIKKGVNAVKQGLKTVGDALKAAAKSLGDAIRSVVNWTAAQLRDFVIGLLNAGRRVAEILGEALKQGTAALDKFVRALLDAGRRLAEILREAKRFAAAQLKRVVHAAYRAIARVGAILVEFARDTLGTIRMVLEGLLAAGVTLAAAIRAIVIEVAEGFRKGFLQGLIALGKAPGKIMLEALKLGGSIAALAFAALLDLFGGHRPLSAEEKKQARRVFGTKIDLDRVKVAVKSLPADLINAVNGGRPFTTMYILNFASWKKIEMKTLIHELGHVWQAAQSGPIYMLQALHAQMKHGDAAYNVTNDMLRANAGRLEKFNREQQAVIAEEYWFNVWGHEVYPNRSAVSSRNLDTALLEPYAARFRGETPKPPVIRVTTRATAALAAAAAASATAPKPPATPRLTTVLRIPVRR
jgi:hypothetical protein